MGIKVGIPGALFYYRYNVLYKTFFEELGAEIIVSEPTNRVILDAGVKSCVNEACLPVKLFHGHVISLRDRVDYIFIPRFTSVSKNEYICPEFGGLPDLVRHSVKNLPPLITTEINLRKSKRYTWRAALETGYYFTKSRQQIKKALEKAISTQKSYEAGQRIIIGQHKANLRVAVIGHPYILYDKYAGMNLLDKLRKMGIEVITPEMAEEAAINKYAACLSKPVFWNYARKAIGSAFYMINECNLDGIVYVMSFGCGIDSFVCDLIERRLKRISDIPFITVTIDEHSGEVGINTRLEAFLDMIVWRKADENNISASW